MANKIMLIRHAEKPNGENGVMPDGTENPEALTATGWRRAQALVGLFDPPGGRFSDPRLARPQGLFASGSDSLRPAQTLAPLAAALSLTVDIDYRKGHEAKLVAAAKAAGGVILIAWQHEAIPAIAAAILGHTREVPPRWPSDRFDLVWVFDLEDGAAWSFEQAPELLLPGSATSDGQLIRDRPRPLRNSSPRGPR